MKLGKKKKEKNVDPKTIGAMKIKDVKAEDAVITENSIDDLGDENIESPVETEKKESSDLGDENKEQSLGTGPQEKSDLGDENVKTKPQMENGMQKLSPQDHVNVLSKYINDHNQMIFDIRSFRRRIDYIMKIIDLTGIQKEITLSINNYNPVEHCIVSLVKAKGSLGELIKKTTPSPDMIAFKAYLNYLDLCTEFGEEPTYKEFFTELPKEYLDGLISAVEHAMKNNLTAEENHQNWIDDKIKNGWKFGEVKDAEKKTHPSLVPFAELPESEKKKATEFLRIVNEYKNPYTYPKQTSEDVEATADVEKVNDLNIVLEEGRYFKGDKSIVLVGDLNRVQLVDYIKSLIAELISDYVSFNGRPFVNYFIRNIVSVHMDDRLATLLAGITKSSVYTDLIDAKNLFGYTFQYVK